MACESLFVALQKPILAKNFHFYYMKQVDNIFPLSVQLDT